MKVIELLSKIAKGEVTSGTRLKIKDKIYFYLEDKCYFQREDDDLYVYTIDLYRLNDEVEIIEGEKEIEFDNFSSYTCNVGRVDESNIEEYIHTLFSQQMRLIENQKKIIDVINDMRDKE